MFDRSWYNRAGVEKVMGFCTPDEYSEFMEQAPLFDFVSMGATSANKILRIIEQAQQVIAIELLCAAQMLEFRKPLKPGAGVQQALDLVRSYVPKLEHDRVLAPDIATMTRAVQEGVFNVLD